MINGQADLSIIVETSQEFHLTEMGIQKYRDLNDFLRHP
jgi:hypothetical protein